MERNNVKTKRILDSVHGYVQIPEYYVDNIIDTIQFQRLRRIEQTSCRALFPSARHDRFIHSIGVFHIGSLIAETLWRKCANVNESMNTRPFVNRRTAAQIIITYRLACLLHDVGHTPFSHTFEEYFINNDNKLPQKLAELIPEDNEFINDFWCTYNPDSMFAAHEVISAYVAIKYFRNIIASKRNNWEGYKASGIPSLLVRMIVGCYYRDNGKKTASLENAFIELIHGEVIDADGLDYACRDVWASGYSTSKIDVNRLIESIMIHRQGNDYTVCYDAKAINEIRSVLQVKNFQYDFVFNHHSVLLEQEMLKKAMQSAAIYHMKMVNEENDDDETFRKKALMKLCNLKMYSSKGFRTMTGIKISWPMDDDFVSLMKYCMNDPYVSQWLSRQYKMVPLWKTKEAFLADLPVRNKKEMADSHSWIFCKSGDYISDEFNINPKNLLYAKFKYKDRLDILPTIYLYINHDIKKYDAIYKTRKIKAETVTDEWDNQPAYAMDFRYIYVPKVDNTNTKLDLNTLKSAIIEKAKTKYNANKECKLLTILKSIIGYYKG